NSKAIHLFSSGINLHPVPRYGVKSEPSRFELKALSCLRYQKEDPCPGYPPQSRQGLSRVFPLARRKTVAKESHRSERGPVSRIPFHESVARSRGENPGALAKFRAAGQGPLLVISLVPVIARIIRFNEP